MRVSPNGRLALLAVLAAFSLAAFMTIGASGSWTFVLQYRGIKLAALLLVGCAVAVSTVLFQTITHNRILTPSVMGLDALYVLIQSALVFSLGSAGLAGVDPRLKFVLEVPLMVGLAWGLFRWHFFGAARSLHLALLVGLVFGLLFRSLTSFLLRLIDPNEYSVLQDRMFASFNVVAHELLAVAGLTVLGVLIAAWRMRHAFDTLALGRDLAVNLGLDYRGLVMRLLVLIALLVSVSTALVGPVNFFGSLVANLAYKGMGSEQHRHTLPAAMLLACIFLVGGQVVLERVFSFDSALSIVVEFLGGLIFLALLMHKGTR